MRHTDDLWPPERNSPCWRGSGGKYKKCCGTFTYVYDLGDEWTHNTFTILDGEGARSTQYAMTATTGW
jgi:hypothetical protein